MSTRGNMGEFGSALRRRIARACYRIRKWIEQKRRVPGVLSGHRLYPLPGSLGLGDWTYHDERWIRVVERRAHRRALREGRGLSVVDDIQRPPDGVQLFANGTLRVDRAPPPADRWVYLYLCPRQYLWRDFVWTFSVQRDSEFRELQFGFRYHDFYNRYRFRHEDGHFHYDRVVNGRFENSIVSCPFPMELGRAYSLAIKVVGNRFTLSVDGRIYLDEFDFENLFPQGSVAIILWEDDGQTPIRAAIDEITVMEL